MKNRACRLKCLLLAVALTGAAVSGASVASAADKVVLEQRDPDRLEVLINGQPFATYNYSSKLPKPFLLPVRTPSGVVINRDLEDATDGDHPHHKGMWNSVDEVNAIICLSFRPCHKEDQT